MTTTNDILSYMETIRQPMNGLQAFLQSFLELNEARAILYDGLSARPRDQEFLSELSANNAATSSAIHTFERFLDLFLGGVEKVADLRVQRSDHQKIVNLCNALRDAINEYYGDVSDMREVVALEKAYLNDPTEENLLAVLYFIKNTQGHDVSHERIERDERIIIGGIQNLLDERKQVALRENNKKAEKQISQLQHLLNAERTLLQNHRNLNYNQRSLSGMILVISGVLSEVGWFSHTTESVLSAISFTFIGAFLLSCALRIIDILGLHPRTSHMEARIKLLEEKIKQRQLQD